MEKKKSYFNLPNALSFYRIISAPFLVWLAFLGEKQWFTWLILFSFFTDMADGFIARRWNLSSKLGAQLDSVGDALTFVTAVFGVWQFEYAFLMEHKIVVLIAFVPYLLQILLAITIYGRPSSFHTYMAKTAALVQGVFFLCLFFFGPIMWLFYLAVAITVLEVLEEIILLFVLPEWKTDVKGLYWVIRRRRAEGKEKAKLFRAASHKRRRPESSS